MKRFEIYYNEEDNAWALFPTDNPLYKSLIDGQTFVHAFEAEGWEEAKKQYDDLMGHTPGPIRKAVQVGRRVETGPVIFGDDWPGMFLRGDSAFGLAVQIKVLLTNIEKGDLGTADTRIAMRMLESFGKQIDRDVYQGGPRLWPKEEV